MSEHRFFDSHSFWAPLRTVAHVTFLLWQVYRVEMKNWRHPMTIGEAPHIRPRMFIELSFGVIWLACCGLDPA